MGPNLHDFVFADLIQLTIQRHLQGIIGVVEVSPRYNAIRTLKEITLCETSCRTAFT